MAMMAAVAGSALAADAGEAVMVRNDVKGTPPGGAARQMAVGDGIATGLSLVTAEASAIKMTFDPHGALSLGPATSLTVDQSVVDRATGRSTSKLSLLVGSLRVAIGSLFGGEVEVTTPSAVVGIKGTIVYIFVDSSGHTTVIGIEGTATAHAMPSTGTMSITGNTFAVFDPSGPAQGPSSIDPAIRTLLDEMDKGFGNLPSPPGLKPDDKMARDSFGNGAAAGQGKGVGFNLATLSPAAGGVSFTDPQLTAFAISPIIFGQFRCVPNPQTGGCL
jgi:hypothetical protein